MKTKFGLDLAELQKVRRELESNYSTLKEIPSLKKAAAIIEEQRKYQKVKEDIEALFSLAMNEEASTLSYSSKQELNKLYQKYRSLTVQLERPAGIPDY